MDTTGIENYIDPKICDVGPDGVISVKVKCISDEGRIPYKRFKSVNKANVEESSNKQKFDFSDGQQGNQIYDSEKGYTYIKTEQPSDHDLNEHWSSANYNAVTNDTDCTYLKDSYSSLVNQQKKMIVARSIFNLNAESSEDEPKRKKTNEPGDDRDPESDVILATKDIDKETHDIAFRNSVCSEYDKPGSRFSNQKNINGNEQQELYESERVPSFVSDQSERRLAGKEQLWFGSKEVMSENMESYRGVNITDLDSTIEKFVKRALEDNVSLSNTDKDSTLPDGIGQSQSVICSENSQNSEIDGGEMNNLFHCGLCSKTLPNQKQLEKHMDSHLKKHKCDLCGAEFKQKRSLNKHKETSHSEDLPFKCGVCGLHFVCSSSHGKHLKKHSLNNFLQSCTDMSSKSVASLDKDQFKILDLNNLFKPSEKLEIVNSEESLNDCFLKGKSLNREKVLKYECPYCGKKFAEKANLRAHKAIHGEKKYGCDICGKKFNKINNLQKHKIIHTGERPYICPVCGRDFADPSSARRHQRTHTGLKPHKCEMCGKHFSETSLLNRHKKRHMNYRPFACTMCDKSFGDADHLSRHFRTHTGEKPFSCEICGQRFTQSSSLNVHMRRHNGIRPFQCGICLQDFTRALHLRKHLARLHGEDRPHKCDLCGKQYQTEEELENHQKTHFEDEESGKEEGLQETNSERMPGETADELEKSRKTHFQDELDEMNGNKAEKLKTLTDRSEESGIL